MGLLERPVNPQVIRQTQVNNTSALLLELIPVSFRLGDPIVAIWQSNYNRRSAPGSTGNNATWQCLGRNSSLPD